MMMNSTTLFIWDEKDQAPNGNWVKVYWRKYKIINDQEEVSVPQLVELHADLLKKRLLAWIYELGEVKINERSLVDHLEIRQGFSYWWMSVLLEKSYAKSPRFYDAVRLFALEQLITTRHVQSVILVSKDRVLVSTINNLCKNLSIDFVCKKHKESLKNVYSIRKLYSYFPHWIQSSIFLVRYCFKRWPLRKTYDSSTTRSQVKLTFIDYFAHLHESSVVSGQFASNYWTTLIDCLSKTNRAVNWLHHYVPHIAVPNVQQATELISKFNQAPDQNHNFLEDVINFTLVCAALKDYIRLTWISFRIKKVKKYFKPKSSSLDFWPLFKLDWQRSLRGSLAIENCIMFNLLEKKIHQLPKQELGIYLQENQAWEMALIYVWRAAKHEKLIGVAHSTVRYWDLRYFYDSRSYYQNNKYQLPMPDLVAVNGSVAFNAYHDGGYPDTRLIKVEALRYLYLQNIIKSKANCNLPHFSIMPMSRDFSAGAIVLEKEQDPVCKQRKVDNVKAVTIDYCNKSSLVRVLICGDMIFNVSQQMISWLEIAVDKLYVNAQFIFKPHPLCEAGLSSKKLMIQETKASLTELITEFDVVFTSNITSAAVDGYSFGLPVIQMLDGEFFNMSPLRGLKNVVYVTDPNELAEALNNIQCFKSILNDPYFYLDRQLLRWQKLLEITT